MSSSLRAAFERDGAVRVPDVIDKASLAPMRDVLRQCIEELELVEVAGAMRPARGTELALWDLGRDAAFAPLPGAFASAVERVFGPGAWTQPDDELGGYAMPNLPCPGATATPTAVAWHVDEPTELDHVPHHRLIGYALLDRVDPGGGATVVLTGSHRRLARLADALGTPCTTDVVVDNLRRDEPWFAELMDPTVTDRPWEFTSAGISLRIHELTGEAGDFILLNPCCLHTTSANASRRPRLTMRMTGLRV